MQALNSPTKYIRTKARQCPIYKCRINNDWAESGLALIFITRKMPSGKFISGAYQVDLYAQGLKDTYCSFNSSNEETEEIIDTATSGYDLEMEEVEYALAHNIIYEGIAYGESLQFKPHKDFELTKFILEEDTEEIEEIEIVCGFYGKPAVVISSDNSKAKMIAHLRRLVGDNGFTIIDLSSDDPYDEEDESDEELDEIVNNMSDESIMQLGDKMLEQSPVTKKVNQLYADKFSDGGMKRSTDDEVFENYSFITDIETESLEYRTERESYFNSPEDFSDYIEISSGINSGDDLTFDVEEIWEMLYDNPENPYLYVLFSLTLAWYDIEDNEVEEAVKESVTKFPFNIDLRLALGQFYLNKHKPEEFKKLFYRGFDLRLYASPGKRIFRSQVCLCWVQLALYFSYNNKLEEAEYYLDKAASLKQYEHLASIIDVRAYLVEAKSKKLFGKNFLGKLKKLSEQLNDE